MFQMGEVLEFSIPLYYRACNNTADFAALKNERDVFLVACYENQILDGKNWVPAVFSQHHACNFSSSDATVECSRESYELPDPTKWIWLNLWRQDSLSHDKEGWMYSGWFD
ncbi:hypothetical protein LSM04_009085 [Trypanosoma melophagium]|uniref:uncharacterized protein n=1 Tax=Trypanosoma melophagium TaxID=715481 RepID=UPI00351A5174|nr:hypothetical protein LSM04_009085 [Trypanosoma melophagium]